MTPGKPFMTSDLNLHKYLQRLILIDISWCIKSCFFILMLKLKDIDFCWHLFVLWISGLICVTTWHLKLWVFLVYQIIHQTQGQFNSESEKLYITVLKWCLYINHINISITQLSIVVEIVSMINAFVSVVIAMVRFRGKVVPIGFQKNFFF